MDSQAVNAQKYLYAAHAGLAVLAAIVATFAFGAPDFFKGFFVGVMIVIVLLLMRRKMRDEYVERLWNAGTAWAFIATLASAYLSEFLRGLVDGLLGRSGNLEPITLATAGFVALSAFFIGFHVEMWRQR